MGRNGDLAGRIHRAYAWARDGQIHYRRSGPAGARSPLVLVHPQQSSSASFDEFMSEMGRERSVIAPDLPGLGMSDPLREPPSVAALAGAILDVVAELGLGIVDVLGTRDGGEIALEMARQRPEVVRRLVLVSAPAPQGLLSQPTLALDLPAFPESGAGEAVTAMREFLDG